MQLRTIMAGETQITKVLDDEWRLRTEQDALDLMANTPSDHIVIHERNVDPRFFDLSTKIAGGILQKLTNYRIRLAIIGDFSKYPSQTLKDFIYESNRRRDHLFVASMEEVIAHWQPE